MDKASHLSVIVDLSPTQWHLSSLSNNQFPLSLDNFLSQLLTFLNTHVASKHENTLAVFGAFPGKRFASPHKTYPKVLIIISLMLYSSTDPGADQLIDANAYPPFRIVDSSVMRVVIDEVEATRYDDEQGQYSI